jgi:hypothetical protein
MLETITSEQLSSLLGREPRALSDALERGRVVYFPRCPIELPREEDLAFLRGGVAAHLKRKNVSWYFASDSLKGLESAPPAATRAHQLLREHAGRVREFLERAMPEFSRGWTPGTTSFRPLQEKGRALSAHASNELVHVDAGAYGATHGARVLRFFVNVNTSEDRVWVSKGAFPELFTAHGKAAGVQRDGGLEEGVFDRAFSAAVRAGAKVAPSLRMIDSSPYDRLMRRFHNWMKDAPAFRDSKDGLTTLRFGPMSAWMVLTDQVSHACIEGQHALVDTFIVPLENCRLRELSPFEILRTGRAPEARQ